MNIDPHNILHFIKMHSLGNDFIMIDGIRQNISLSTKQIQAMSDRHKGIGFDQCIVVYEGKDKETDFYYVIYNADGQEVGQCGNGARCLTHFLIHTGLSKKSKIAVETITTRMQLLWKNANHISIEMPRPKFLPKDIPFLTSTDIQESYSLRLFSDQPNEINYSVQVVNVGNPHAVVFVENVETFPVEKIGKVISNHPAFPEKCNVGFLEKVSHDYIKLRVYERGCAETAACGSGAVAAVAIGRLYCDLGPSVRVDLPGGQLGVSWPEIEGPIFLEGPSTLVYEGSISLSSACLA